MAAISPESVRTNTRTAEEARYNYQIPMPDIVMPMVNPNQSTATVAPTVGQLYPIGTN